MECRSKIFSINISTESSCELATLKLIPGSSSIAASSSQNSLPGGSFTKENTDMKGKKMRGGYTCFAPGYYSNTKET